MIDDDVSILADINEVVGMEPVVLIDIHRAVPVPQGEDGTRAQATRWVGRDDRVHTIRQA